MSHVDEYDEAMIASMDLIWGEGFMAPGGEGNVHNMVRGIELKGKCVLDIGCGQGRPACIVAEEYGAYVVGTDLEEHLVQRSIKRARQTGLSEQTEFHRVQPGPLQFEDNSFDLVMSSGAFTQVEDKLGMYRECLRVLKPGGMLSCYDWMKTAGEYSADMLYWFEVEGLTYAMKTPEEHRALYLQAGFQSAEVEDRSAWFRRQVRLEYEQISTGLRGNIVDLLGEEETVRFIEDWRAMTVVCEKGEMLQVYSRAYTRAR
jgi:ubiquinone/menaquinone biosynthesis C-methylase UbiE